MAWTGQAATTTQVRLLLASEMARPGDTVMAGVQLKMAPHWHTYWRNGGDSGGPTKVEWTLPAGVTAGEIQWPVPEKLVAASTTTYVYHDEVTLLAPLTLANDLAAGPIELKAKVTWLECEELCLMGRTNVSATLAVGKESKPSAVAPLLDAARKKLPQAVAKLPARARWDAPKEGETRPLVIEWEVPDRPAEVEFFPHAHDHFDVQAATERFPDEGDKVRLRKVVNKLEGDWPKAISGLLVAKYAAGRMIALEGSLNTSAAVGAQPVPLPATGAGGSPSHGSLLFNLVLAFLGGLILNLMPCVLPVIALKILGFVHQSSGSPAQTRKLGLVYGLGVVVSLLALAGVVVAVQKAGKLASWGMQFQNPQFVVVITTVVTLVALNLFGVFEVVLSGRALSAAGGLMAREGVSGAFFNGVLAVVLATPCTAPFLSLALGYAFSQPPAVIALTFVMVAAGLALPYVVLSFFPQWLRFLPKPGAWMERFKVAMGFPMLATALWLLTLTAAHFGATGVLWVGLFLVMVSVSVWVWGQFVQRGSKRRGLAGAIALAFLAVGYVYALEVELNWRHPSQAVKSPGSLKQGKDGIDWQPWSAAAVDKARAEGRPVLVDFTADWCLTCQANKKTSLEIASVRQKLKETQAVALLGDYTLEDPAIAAELKRFERAGVPLVLVYPKDTSQPPMVLPTVLTPASVLDALDKAAKSATPSQAGGPKP